MSVLFVALGGFFGSMIRYYLSIKANKKIVGTWIANITGSLLLSITLQLYLADILSYSLWAFLGIGFCGAYTTYSTFGNETLQLLLNKDYKAAITYVLSSFGVSLLFVSLVYLFNSSN